MLNSFSRTIPIAVPIPNLALRVNVTRAARATGEDVSVEAFVGVGPFRASLSDQSPYNTTNCFGNRAE
jgi:hypothetical protein